MTHTTNDHLLPGSFFRISNQVTRCRTTLTASVVLLSLVLFPFKANALFSSVSLWGWEGSIIYVNAANVLAMEYQTGATQSQCQQRQDDDLQDLIGLGLSIQAINQCAPNVVAIDPDIWRVPYNKIPIPFPGPVCLSCPFLSNEFVKQAYPARVEDVQNLMDKYGIRDYNKQLRMLQENYDLEGFEAEMYNLQKDQLVDEISNGL